MYYDSCIDGYEYIFDNCEGFFSESPYRVSLTRFDRTGCRNCTLFLSPVFDANTPNVNTSFRVDIHLNGMLRASIEIITYTMKISTC